MLVFRLILGFISFSCLFFAIDIRRTYNRNCFRHGEDNYTQGKTTFWVLATIATITGFACVSWSISMMYRLVVGIICIVSTFVARSIYQKSKSKCSAVFCWIFGTISAITGISFAFWSLSKFITEFSFMNWLIPSVFSIFETAAIEGDTYKKDAVLEATLTSVFIGIFATIIFGIIWVINLGNF